MIIMVCEGNQNKLIMLRCIAPGNLSYMCERSVFYARWKLSHWQFDRCLWILMPHTASSLVDSNSSQAQSSGSVKVKIHGLFGYLSILLNTFSGGKNLCPLWTFFFFFKVPFCKICALQMVEWGKTTVKVLLHKNGHATQEVEHTWYFMCVVNIDWMHSASWGIIQVEVIIRNTELSTWFDLCCL